MSTPSSHIPYFLPEWPTSQTCLRGTCTDEFFSSAFLPANLPCCRQYLPFLFPSFSKYQVFPNTTKQSQVVSFLCNLNWSLCFWWEFFHALLLGSLVTLQSQALKATTVTLSADDLAFVVIGLLDFSSSELLNFSRPLFISFFSRENINHPPFQGQLLRLSLIVCPLLFIFSVFLAFLSFSLYQCKDLFHWLDDAHFFIIVIFEIRTHFLTGSILKLNGSVLFFPFSPACTIRCALQSRLCKTRWNTVTAKA